MTVSSREYSSAAVTVSLDLSEMHQPGKGFDLRQRGRGAEGQRGRGAGGQRSRGKGERGKGRVENSEFGIRNSECHPEPGNRPTPFMSSRPREQRDPLHVIPTEGATRPPPCHPDRGSNATPSMSSRPREQRDPLHIIPTEGATRPPPCHPDRGSDATPSMSSRPREQRDPLHVIPTEGATRPPPCHPDRGSEASERRDLGKNPRNGVGGGRRRDPSATARRAFGRDDSLRGIRETPCGAAVPAVLCRRDKALQSPFRFGGPSRLHA